MAPGASGATDLSELQRPIKEKSLLPSQPLHYPLLLDLPNKNKVTMKKEWPVLLLCRTVGGYPIVTHSVRPLILLFL